MFVTLTQLQNGEASPLQTVIDNTCGNLHVALRGFHYEVGYRNVGSSSGALWVPAVSDGPPVGDNRPQKILVSSGLYNFEQLATVLMEDIPGVTLKIAKATGIVKLSIQDAVLKTA